MFSVLSSGHRLWNVKELVLRNQFLLEKKDLSCYNDTDTFIQLFGKKVDIVYLKS